MLKEANDIRNSIMATEGHDIRRDAADLCELVAWLEGELSGLARRVDAIAEATGRRIANLERR
jgi:hypothetical protein